MGKGASTEQVVREIHRRTRRRFSAEEKVRIVLEGLRGEQSVAELCRREGLAPNLRDRDRAARAVDAGHLVARPDGDDGMPAFPALGTGDITAIVEYVHGAFCTGG